MLLIKHKSFKIRYLSNFEREGERACSHYKTFLCICVATGQPVASFFIIIFVTDDRMAPGYDTRHEGCQGAGRQAPGPGSAPTAPFCISSPGADIDVDM